MRKKLGLGSIDEPEDNICEPFYPEVEDYLRKTYPVVETVDDTYKEDYEDDVYFQYYSGDRNFMNTVGMEEKGKLEHRFDAWRVSK